MTALTIEMDMLVVVVVMTVVTVAQLVAHAVASVLKDMYQMVFAKEGQCTEDARLVDRKQLSLKFSERQGSAGLSQRLHHEYAVGGGLNVVGY